jgi:hypothetical protein
MNIQNSARDIDALINRHEDQHFNPWRVPASARMAGVVSGVSARAEKYEGDTGLRKRMRTEASQMTFAAIITAVVCDLAYHHLADRPNGVAISRSKQTLGKKSRYKAPAQTEMLPAILDYLAAPELAFIRQLKAPSGYDAVGRTVIMPGPQLLPLISGFDLRDLGYSLDAETIILRAAKERDDKTGEPLEYADTVDTLRYRAELREINEWLAAADIEFDDSVAPNTLIDINQRPLRRIFNGALGQGGRLYGGFWQGLKKEQRAEGLVIEGEAVVELDYGQMAPRILYGMAGIEPPPGDLYSIPGLEHWRDGVKAVFNAALSAERPLSRRPRGTKDILPAGRFSDILATVKSVHPAIAGLLGTGAGLRAMFTESEILVRVLLDLKKGGIVALPVHDAVLVKASEAGPAEGTMKAVFKAVTGVEALVARA